jgi:hypothetical protein
MHHFGGTRMYEQTQHLVKPLAFLAITTAEPAETLDPGGLGSTADARSEQHAPHRFNSAMAIRMFDIDAESKHIDPTTRMGNSGRPSGQWCSPSGASVRDFQERVHLSCSPKATDVPRWRRLLLEVRAMSEKQNDVEGKEDDRKESRTGRRHFLTDAIKASLLTASVAAGFGGIRAQAKGLDGPSLNPANVGELLRNLSGDDLQEICKELVAEDGSLDHDSAIGFLQEFLASTRQRTKYARNLLKQARQELGALVQAILNGDVTHVDVAVAPPAKTEVGCLAVQQHPEIAAATIYIQPAFECNCSVKW